MPPAQSGQTFQLPVRNRTDAAPATKKKVKKGTARQESLAEFFARQRRRMQAMRKFNLEIKRKNNAAREANRAALLQGRQGGENFEGGSKADSREERQGEKGNGDGDREKGPFLSPLYSTHGEVIPNFPRTLEEMNQLSDEQADSILERSPLPFNKRWPLRRKRRLVRRFAGVPSKLP